MVLEALRNLWHRVRTAFYPLSNTPPGYWQGRSEYNLRLPGRLYGSEQALALSPFFAALRLYQSAMSSLPLVAYRKDAEGHRHRLEDSAVYNLLHDRPNPAQSRAVFFEALLDDYWLEGECFIHLSWANNHRLLGMYPIPARSIERIDFSDDWRKTYFVAGEADPYTDDEVAHVINFSRNGLRGCSFLRYAGESLGLHKQILDTATSLYANTARVAGQIVQTGNLTKEARDNLRHDLSNDFSGALNAGKMPFMPLGTEIKPLDTKSAESAQLIDALNVSVADIARWFNLSPLLLGDLSRGTYSNSAADKLAFYQKNMMPVLEKFQLEINHKVFGVGSDAYCEFLTDNILRADPLTQSQVWHNGLQDGYLLRSEIRQWLNLPPVDGLDQPTAPLNMGTVPEQPAAPEAPAEEGGSDATADDSQPV